MRGHYAAVTEQYANTYVALLDAAGREPLERLGTTRELAIALTALYDGLLLRDRFARTRAAFCRQ